MKSLLAVCLFSASALGQVSTAGHIASGAVPAQRCLQLINGNQVVVQSGTAPAYGVSMGAVGSTWASGSTVQVGTYGEILLEFDGPLPTSQTGLSFTATCLNGYGHYDPAVVTDGSVSQNQSAVGRIMTLRPDLGNFATVNFRFPASRGSKIVSSDISDFAVAVKANQNVSAGPTGPAGVLYYGTSGALTNVKCFIGSTTSSASTGAWSISIAPAGLTTLISVQTNAKSTGTTASTTFQPSTVTTSTSTVSGQVYGYATSVVGLVPLTQATTATTVMVEACGT